MAVSDVDVPRSPGWWMKRLAMDLSMRQQRLRILDDYFVGRPPIIGGSPNQQAAFYRFQQIARSNFAALVVQARRDRLGVRSIHTAVEQSGDGDDTAWQRFTTGNGPRAVSDLARYVTVFGSGHVAASVRLDGSPWYTAEDPRQMTTYVDPETGETLAAFKLFHDYLADLDFACLWLPGEKWVAVKTRRLTPPRQVYAQGPPPPVLVSFDPSTYEMMPFREDTAEADTGTYPAYSERYDFDGVPVETVEGRDGVGAFELHTDLLDRINHQILQRVVIAVMQAFKQRGIKLPAGKDLPTHDQFGKEIDYDDIFSADPGSLWKLPDGMDIWESGQVDLQGVLSAVTDDVKHLSAVTKTPVNMFMPDGANQSASGSDLQREGLVFDVEDLQRLLGAGVGRAVATSFRMIGDTTRAGSVGVEWLPAERYSLAEKAAADNQAQSLTWNQKQRVIWQMTPSEIAQAQVERTQDAMSALLAAPPVQQPQRPAPADVNA